MSTTRTIAVTGASEQDVARISALLEKHRHKLSSPWESGRGGDADLLLVDIESMYGQMDWLRARSRGRLVVAYTSAAEPLEPEFSLRKPVVSSDLVTLLNRISENMGSGKAEATPMRPANAESYEAPPAPKAEVVRIAERKPGAAAASPIELKPVAAVVEAPAEIKVSHPETHRVDELLAVLDAADGPVRLVYEGLPSIIIDPARQRWYAGVALKALWDWAKLPLRRSELIHLNAAEFAAATEILPAQQFSRLVWFAHLAREPRPARCRPSGRRALSPVALAASRARVPEALPHRDRDDVGRRHDRRHRGAEQGRQRRRRRVHQRLQRARLRRVRGAVAGHIAGRSQRPARSRAQVAAQLTLRSIVRPRRRVLAASLRPPAGRLL